VVLAKGFCNRDFGTFFRIWKKAYFGVKLAAG
jgi:hypothetical protein